MPIPNHWRETIEAAEAEAKEQEASLADVIPFPGARVRRVDAPVGRRVLAHGVDLFISLGVSMYFAQFLSLVLTMLYSDLFLAAGNQGEELFYSLWDWSNLVLWGSALFVFHFLYQVVALATRGRTLGKAWLGLRLENSIEPRPASLWQVCKRVGMYFLSYLSFGLAAFWTDSISQTHIILDEKN